MQDWLIAKRRVVGAASFAQWLGQSERVDVKHYGGAVECPPARTSCLPPPLSVAAPAKCVQQNEYALFYFVANYDY
jgi:hypothetical protein